MQDYASSPSALTVHVGDTVTWTNHDQAPHDVTPAATAVPKATQQKTTIVPRSPAGQRQPVAQQPTSAMSMPAPVESAAPTVDQPQPAVAASAAPTTTLDPMLIVAGVAAAVAVLCLLLLGSRPET